MINGLRKYNSAIYMGLSPILSKTTFGMYLYFSEMRMYTGYFESYILITTAGIVFG
jgi:hypothetical protein